MSAEAALAAWERPGTPTAISVGWGWKASSRNAKDLPYRSGCGEHWLKIKCVQAQEFVILGYVPSTAGADMVGSLVLGYYEDGKLVHAGRVGTGWSHKLSRTLRDMIEKLHAPKPTFGSPLREVLNFREEARDA